MRSKLGTSVLMPVEEAPGDAPVVDMPTITDPAEIQRYQEADQP